MFYGGAAGGGKSEFLLIDVSRQVNKKNYKAVLFRKSYPELEKSIILRSHELYPALGGHYSELKHRWTFPSGAIIDFGYLDNDRAVYAYQSAAYAYLGFDEATHFTEFQIEYLKSRCRCADKTVKKYIRYASNPGNIGHVYFYDRFIGGKEPYKEYVDEKTGLTKQFIPSKVYDNLVLMREDPEYVNRLEGLPEKEQKMLLHGNWDVFEGMYFNEWDKEVHTCEPFAIPDTWKKIRCIDHGRTAPTACLWGAIDYDGCIWWYREYYKAGVDADINASEIKRLSLESYWFTVLDSSCFSKTGTGETIAEIYERSGIICEPSPKDRLAGWNLFHQYLRHDKENKPKMVFFSTCLNAIRTIPTLLHDEKKPEDLNSKMEDHCADSISYGLQYLHESKSPVPLTPLEKQLKEWREQWTVNPNNLNKFYSNRL